ncbi:hypothetical protein [Vogesella sp. LIG4]|uniref:hypothetical protein n=1 Tax=Vogesella sp. LIG4 TaxID=1192162 RepID=UPI00081FF60B|nr:hypothetical protein [Vogesella sp. LIG4]SCK05895.1 hypothetical protein PSELUDRAFT_0180 [Vogesella sp. LIG4]
MKHALLAALLLPAWAAAATVELSLSGNALIYNGELSEEANQRLFALYERMQPKPGTLVITSEGGMFEQGLELGKWVFAHRLAVSVPRYCNSSCANYVFTAASQRELGLYAIVVFHGGMMDTSDRLGQMLYRYPAAQRAQVQPRIVAQIRDKQQRETAFFRMIGVDQRITSYGYQPVYRSGIQRYAVWSYSLPMLARFGVGNIHVTTDDKWFPRPGNHGLMLISAPGEFACIPPGMAIDRLIDCRDGHVLQG